MKNHDRCNCKVGRVIDEFALDDMDDELASRRAGVTEPPASLRDLADYFNQEVVRRAIDLAGESPLDGEVENIYRLLTDDDVSRGMKIRVRNRLTGEGVDLDAVEGSFVSHPTMANHLQECLGVKRANRTEDRVRTASERILKMRSRAEAVIRNTLSGLASAGKISAGDLTVIVDVQVMCEDCGRHTGVDQFMDRGGCDCNNAE